MPRQPAQTMSLTRKGTLRNPHQAPRWQGGKVYELGEPHNPYEIDVETLLTPCWCGATCAHIPKRLVQQGLTHICARTRCQEAGKV